MDFINHIFKEINDNYYVYLREITKNTVRFKVLSNEEITRNVYLEKLYDYLATVNVKNNIDADKKEYISVYMNSLYSLMNKNIAKKSREEKYILKAKKLMNQLKKDPDNEPVLKDFTRIFVSIYSSQDNKFSFDISLDRLNKTIDGIKNEKENFFIFKGKDKISELNRYEKMQYIIVLMTLVYLAIISETEVSSLENLYEWSYCSEVFRRSI